MINLFLFLSVMFLMTFLLGKTIEKIRVPWIFAALILGSLLDVYNPFPFDVISPEFNFLAKLGMYFLLFVVGFELDLKELKGKSKFIVKGTFFIIFLEAFFGTMFVYFVFGIDLIISFLVALSFATVGEAVLIPILDEFRIINTKLGQSIIGIGALDDIIEVFTLVLAAVLVSSLTYTSFNIGIVLLSLFLLFLLTISLTKLKEEGKQFNVLNIETLFLFVIFILFLFIGIGEYADSTALAALLAGISLKTFVPSKRLKLIESEVKTMCYGFFAPVFFLWVGITMDMKYLITYHLLVFLVVLISNGSKLLGSCIIGRKELGNKQSILLGLGLSVRFSTSIVIIKILLENGLIHTDLYSVIIASTVVFTFLVPVLFSHLLVKWKIGKK